MNEDGKSDGPIVPRKLANNGGGNQLNDVSRDPATSPAERAEGRGPAKGNSLLPTGRQVEAPGTGHRTG